MKRRNRGPVGRLTVVDELFLYRHRGLGLPSVMQGLWRTDHAVSAPLLISLHDALSQGPLGRTVVRSAIPGARPRFEASTVAYPLRFADRPIPDGDLMPWADEQTEVDLDPEHGPGWALTATLLASGGTVVSLVCSHVLTDARGLVAAVADALAGTVTRPDDAGTTDDSDLRDALRLFRRVAAGLRHVRIDRGPRETLTARPVHRRPRTAIVDLDASAFDRAAHAADGTPNSLFLALTAGIARRAGIPAPVRVSVPVDARDPATASNGVTIAAVTVTDDDTPATLRVKASAAYRQPRDGAPHGLPPELLQLLPDRLAARLARGAGERDLLCSNIGRTPALLDSFGPHRAVGLAMRAMHPHLGETPTSTPTRLSAYLSRRRELYTLSFVALDDTAFADGDVLRARIDEELHARSLTPRHW